MEAYFAACSGAYSEAYFDPYLGAYHDPLACLVPYLAASLVDFDSEHLEVDFADFVPFFPIMHPP